MRIKFWFSVAFFLSVIVYAASASAQTAPVECVPSGDIRSAAVVQLTNQWTTHCVSTVGDTRDVDTNVVGGVCGTPQAQWRIHETEHGVEFVSVKTGCCLSTIGNDQEIDVNVGAGVCGQANAYWQASEVSGATQYTNNWTSFCLGTHGDSQDVDTNVVGGACGRSNGLWTVETVR